MTRPPSREVYSVRVAPDRHEIDVTLVLEGTAAEGAIGLQTPTWVPGDYEFAPYGRDVFDVRASDPRTSKALTVRRKDWQSYEVLGGTGAVEVSHVAACSSTSFSEACGILGDRGGVLLGARYLYAPAHPGACTVTYELPEGWALHHPSGARRVGERSWEYPSYEVLLDTPVVMGGFDCLTRDINGTPFHHLFLNRGVGSGSGQAALVDQLVKIATEYHELFGSFPFDDYTYVFSLDPRDEWGLEHLTSTMIGLGPEVFTDPDQYGIGVRTCAHELFHAWNVRRLRPAPLERLDLRGGSFTDGLWLAEGFTRYYEFLTCTRTGLYSPAQFFSSIVNYYRHLVALPAYERVSPLDASAASYLNHGKYPGRVNSAIDYYDAGMLIAFDLDAVLRSDGDGASLDDAFRVFYERFAGRGAGWRTADVCDLFEDIKPGLGEQVSREAGEPGRLSSVEQLTRIGFEVGEQEVPCLGLVMQDDVGPSIYSVLDTSPAGRSGVAAEDVITAVDGVAFSLESLRWVCAHAPSVTLDVLRGSAPRRYEIPVGRRTQIGTLTWVGGDEQAQRIARWLKRDFAPRHGERFALDFYENFHGVETVI